MFHLDKLKGTRLRCILMRSKRR